jgi:hypothetical protein
MLGKGPFKKMEGDDLPSPSIIITSSAAREVELG